MSAEERCGVTELVKSQCSHCRPKPAKPALPGIGRWFDARFDSECDGPCGREIAEGDPCRADGEGGWLCQRCGADYD